MAIHPTVQFGLQSYQSLSRPLSSQRCVNMYAEKQASGAKSQIAIFGAPGIVTFATCGSGPVRGFVVMRDILYVVSGAFLYSVTSGGAVVNVGGQISGSGTVIIATNGAEIVIVNGASGYIYSTDAGFRLISDIDFHAANTVTFFDSFFAFDEAGSNEWFISDSLAGSDYSDFFASAETKSDNILAVLNHLQLMHIFGTDSIEFWSNVGAANFPFQRVPGGVLARGIAGPHAVTVEDNAVFLIGEDRIGYRLDGTKLTKISTPAIDAEWQTHATMSDASCFSYTFEGHKFVNINLPGANQTWVWDISSGLFHERASRDRMNNDLGRWRGNCSIAAYDKVMIGDRFSGNIGYLDRRTFTEFDDQIHGEVTSAPMHGEGSFVTMPYLDIDMETGVGNAESDNPQVMLAISDDGGRSWGELENWASMGKVGEYKSYVRFDRLGGFYERTFKLTISDPVRRTIMAARCPGLEVHA